MIEFLLQMTLLEQILLGGLLLLFFYQFYFYVRYLAAPLRLNKKQAKSQEARNKTQEGVSIVVCARNEGENLQQFLPALLKQDYPTFEVIVVNDGSEDNTAEVLANFALQYDNLHLSFVPKQAQLRSSKKLALTIGIKAAQYEYILLTDADCVPASKHWISEMVAGFDLESGTKSQEAGRNTTEIVLGYGAYNKEKTLLNRFIQYDTLFNGLQYMGLAIAHHPYMGVGRNLAYRKSTFFAHKGFAGLLGSRAGDDDLFVNKVANKHNTAVRITRDSLTWSLPKQSYREWLIQKERHLGVSPNYKWGTKIRLFFEPFTRALFYAAIICLACLSANWILWVVAGGALFLRWVVQLSILNVAAHRLQGQWFGLSILFFDIYFPLNTLFLFARHAFRKRFLKIDIW